MEDEIIIKTASGGASRSVRRRNGFSPKKRAMFLNALARSCNIKRSAMHAGIDESTPYRVRRDDPIFADQMRDAIEVGRERLALRLLEHGGAGDPLDPPDPCAATDMDGDVPPQFDVELAVLALKATAPAARGERRGGPKPQFAEIEQTDMALMKKLAQLEAQRARVPAQSATDAEDRG